MASFNVLKHNNKVFDRYSEMVQSNVKKQVEKASDIIIENLSTEIQDGGWFVYDHDRKANDMDRPHSIDTWEVTPVFDLRSDVVSIQISNHNTNRANQQYVKYLIDEPYNAGDKSGLTKQKWSDIKEDMRTLLTNEIKYGIRARRVK